VCAFLFPQLALYAQIKPQLEVIKFLKDDLEIASTGNGNIVIQLEFDQDMETSIIPVITTGLDEPFDINLNFGGQLWVNNRIWQGPININDQVPASDDGYYVFKISGAVSAAEVTMDTTLSTAVGNKKLRICRYSQLATSAVAVDFLETIAGISKSVPIILSNEGCATLSISSIAVASPFGFTVDPSDSLIAGDGQEALLTVLFSPTQRGVYSDTLIIVSNDPDVDTLKIPLSGVATAPEIEVNPSSINFGLLDAGVTVSDTIIIYNLEDAESNLDTNLVVTSVAVLSETAFQAPTGGFVVAPGDSYKIVVTFSSSERRAFNGVLRLYNNDPNESLKDITLLANTTDLTPPDYPLNLVGNWYLPNSYWTNIDYVCISWANPDDPSGISEVRWKFDDPPESANDTSAALKQFGVNSFCFPVIDFDFHRVYFWLVDGNGNSGWLNWKSFSYRYDNQAPGTPLNASIRSGLNWTRDDTVSVYWNNPAATAGDFYEVRWKLASRPVSNDDFIGKGPIGFTGNKQFFRINFNQSFCGDDSVYFWLADSAGNANYLNPAAARYFYDSCVPVITRVQPDTITATKNVAFVDTLLITDDVGVDSAWVQYRFGGAGVIEGQPFPLQRVQGSRNKFFFQIPGAGVITRGLEYLVTARDSLGNKYAYGPGDDCIYYDGEDDDYYYYDDYDNAWHAVQVRVTGVGDFRIGDDNNPVALSSGNDQLSYNLVSVPFILNDGKASTVLLDDLGAADSTKWRFFEYRTLQKQLIEYPNTANFEPGRAFFLIVADAGKYIRSGAGKTVATICPDTLFLQPGWNLIGNPFNFPIHKDSSLSIINSISPVKLNTYERGWDLTDIMVPWRGYALYVAPAIDPQLPIYLLIEPKAINQRASKVAASVASVDEWTVQITARAGIAKDHINWAGVRKDASEEYDENDLVEPPVIGSYVSVYFSHLEWSSLPENYTADYRPFSGDGYVWDFNVATATAGQMVTLDFDGVREVPAALEVYLIDEDLGTARNLRHNPNYVYRATGSSKSLKLVVGSRPYVEANSENVALVPNNFDLAQNFPNPFNPETVIRYALPKASTVTLEIYNMLGQKVRTLIDHAPQAADFYTVSWNGRDDRGEAVATGVYIYRFSADGYATSRKMVFMK
jgi:hypothetical protein